MKLTGRLEKRDLEGGIWQLAADDGKRWTLLGASGALTNGDRVEVEGDADEGFGFAMAGPQLRVRRLRKL